MIPVQTELKDIRYVYLLGIGGIGMSALARYFHAAGKKVCGYDKTPTGLTGALIREGIGVHYEDDIRQLPDFLSGKGVNPEALVIYTPAIPHDHNEYNHLVKCGYMPMKRSQVLGVITSGSTTLAVAGTHGKTTTSTMIAHILRSAGKNCAAFLGGISVNYATNLLLPGNENDPVVVEADEFDRSFLTLHPDIAVITSLDADHLDIYGSSEQLVASYQQFASQVKPGGTLVYRRGLPLKEPPVNTITYGIGPEPAVHSTDLRVDSGRYLFDVFIQGTLHSDFVLNWPGRHNVENALGAIAACHTYGIAAGDMRTALASFTGVQRRFDYRFRSPDKIFIDDYAHHPEELKATILSVKELYPGKKILGIFQPHLYSRTRDFADGFGASLSLLDQLILMDIYPARELPIPGVDSAMIASRVTVPGTRVYRRDEVVDEALRSDAFIVLTLGAGDIDQLVPELQKAIETRYNAQTA